MLNPIFPLSRDFHVYWELLEESQGVLTDELDNLRNSLLARGEEAAEQFQLIRDNAESYIEVLDARIEGMQSRKKSLALLSDRAKEGVVAVMEHMNQKTLKLPRFTLTLKAGSQSVDVTDPDLIPPRYTKATVTLPGDQADKVKAMFPDAVIKLAADKVAIKELAKNGVEIVGAQLVTGPNTIQVRRS